MKKILLLAGLITLGVSAQAQPGQGQRQNRQGPPSQEMIEKAKEQLDLSDEQYAEWKELHSSHASEMRDIKDSRSAEAKELRDEFEKKIASILTEEQLEKFNKMKKAGPGSRRGGGRNGQ